MALTYDEIQTQLREAPLIENLGSYLPPIRKNRTVNKFELGVQRRVAHTLYNKRVPIARELARSTSTDTKETVYRALIKNGISPHSVDNYVEYVQLLVSRQGGWRLFRSRLKEELEAVEYCRDSIRNRTMTVIAGLILSMISGIMMSVWLPGSTYGAIPPVTFLVISLAYGSAFVWADVRYLLLTRDEYIGKKSKTSEKFLSYGEALR